MAALSKTCRDDRVINLTTGQSLRPALDRLSNEYAII
jgi:hypothetical protein